MERLCHAFPFRSNDSGTKPATMDAVASGSCARVCHFLELSGLWDGIAVVRQRTDHADA